MGSGQGGTQTRLSSAGLLSSWLQGQEVVGPHLHVMSVGIEKPQNKVSINTMQLYIEADSSYNQLNSTQNSPHVLNRHYFEHATE